METITVASSTGFDGDCVAEKFELVLPLLDAEEIEVISHDDRFVECPGQGLHTTPSATSDCKVYLNDFKGILIPRLHCFHGSCREVIHDHNDRLCRAALARKTWVNQPSSSRSGGFVHSQSRIVRPDIPIVEEVLAQYPWPFDAIVNDPRGKVEESPEYHYFHTLSLFKDDDNLWCGRDVKDTGSPGHVWRFRPMREWGGDTCPGSFICPSTFKRGVHSRSEPNVLQRRYLVVESDELNRDQVGAVFKWMEAKGHNLRAVVDTAGKSLHGWFDFPDPSRIPVLKQDLTVLKCDPAMFGASQPCRLPGALRDGKYQRLIYFKP